MCGGTGTIVPLPRGFTVCSPSMMRAKNNTGFRDNQLATFLNVLGALLKGYLVLCRVYVTEDTETDFEFRNRVGKIPDNMPSIP